MLKRLTSLAAITGILLAGSPVALAQSADIYNPIFNPHANFGHSSDVSASLYARVPFNGGLKRSANEGARFGLTVSTRLPQKFSYAPMSYGNSFQSSLGRQVNVLDLSIGYSFHDTGFHDTGGFQSFKLNGHSFNEINALYADDEEGKKKRSPWPWVLLGGAVVFGAIAITAIAKCDNNGPFGTTTC